MNIKRMAGLGAGLIFLLVLLIFGMRAAASEQLQRNEQLIFVCDADTLVQGSVQAELWARVQSYGAANGQSHSLASAESNQQEARIRAVEQSLQGTRGTVICFGEDYAPVVADLQTRFPEVSFLLLGAEARSAPEGIYEAKSNSHNLLFRARDLGFLAGYGAVMRGERSLGFCAPSETQSAAHYGYGFAQGANLAAARLNLPLRAIALRYWYTDAQDSPSFTEAALASWYDAGVQSLFVGAQGSTSLYQSAHIAAENRSSQLIALAFAACAQGTERCTLLQQDYGTQMALALDSLRENGGAWPPDRAGQSLRLGLSDGALSLARAGTPWQWGDFSPEAHEALLAEFKAGTLALSSAGHLQEFPAAPYVSLWLYS